MCVVCVLSRLTSALRASGPTTCCDHVPTMWLTLFPSLPHRMFENVSELDIMFGLHQAYAIEGEMLSGAGRIVETNKKRILQPLLLMEKYAKKKKKKG